MSSQCRRAPSKSSRNNRRRNHSPPSRAMRRAGPGPPHKKRKKGGDPQVILALQQLLVKCRSVSDVLGTVERAWQNGTTPNEVNLSTAMHRMGKFSKYYRDRRSLVRNKTVLRHSLSLSLFLSLFLCLSLSVCMCACLHAHSLSRSISLSPSPFLYISLCACVCLCVCVCVCSCARSLSIMCPLSRRAMAHCDASLPLEPQRSIGFIVSGGGVVDELSSMVCPCASGNDQ